MHVGWAERFLRSPTNTVGLRKKRSAQPTCNEAQHQRNKTLEAVLLTRLTLVTFTLAFIVIILGAYTRLTNAGLSCPDWPHCYGFITAPHTSSQLQTAAQNYPLMPVDVKKAWTEMTHRYVAGTEGLLILIFSVSLLRHRKEKDIKSSIIAISLIILLGVQVLLGMLTVTEKLKPVIVLSHLLTGLSLLSVLWWAYLDSSGRMRGLSFPRRREPIYLVNSQYNRMGSRLRGNDKPRILCAVDVSKVSPPRPLAFMALAALLLVIMQITLGGWVSTHYAGLACVDFPYCNGKLLPAMQWNNLNGDMITIHMLHRIGALITASYLSLFSLSLLRFSSFRLMGIMLLALIILQITLGILNIVWLRPIWIALTHQSVAIILLLTIIAVLIKASTENQYGST